MSLVGPVGVAGGQPLSSRAAGMASFEGGSFTGVSCVSSNDCIAVGGGDYTGSQLLAAGWDGSSWSRQSVPSPSGAGDSSLAGVSCASSTSCVAVGTASGPSVQPFTEVWNGTTWSARYAPEPRGTTDAHFTGVSCPSRTDCVAVGWFLPSHSGAHALAERWNGQRWSIQSLPRGVSALEAVSCPTARRCMAVGAGVERWTGRRWVASLKPSIALYAVSCSSGNRCTGLGYSKKINVFAQRWNGKRWSKHSFDGSLSHAAGYGVSCPSDRRCIAVGGYEPAGGTGWWVEQWDGSTWALADDPGPAGAATGKAGDLGAVSCATSSACIATGAVDKGDGMSGPLASRWNGRTWSDISP